MGLFGKSKPKRSLEQQIKDQKALLETAKKKQINVDTYNKQKQELQDLKNKNLNQKLKPLIQTVKPVGKILGNIWNSIEPIDPMTLKKIPRKQPIKKQIKQVKKIKIKKQKIRPRRIEYF